MAATVAQEGLGRQTPDCPARAEARSGLARGLDALLKRLPQALRRSQRSKPACIGSLHPVVQRQIRSGSVVIARRCEESVSGIPVAWLSGLPIERTAALRARKTE